MKFLRRSMIGSIAGAAAAWSWRNRNKLTNRSDQPDPKAQAKNHYQPAANQTSAERASTGANVPAEASTPAS